MTEEEKDKLKVCPECGSTEFELHDYHIRSFTYELECCDCSYSEYIVIFGEVTERVSECQNQ